LSNQTLSTSMVEIGGFKLSITTRSVGDNPEVMEALTFRTIGAYLHLAKKIQAEAFELGEAERGSVESRYLAFMQESDPEFNLVDAWGDARVTIWDKSGLDFHLNSDDDYQTALYTWKAHKLAIHEALKMFAPPARQETAAQPAPAGEKPATPKSQNAFSNGDRTYYKKNEAVEKLQVGDQFNMQVCQIACVSDKKGNRQYEFYSKYGTTVGKHPEITLYADNEVAVKNGLIAQLDGMGIQLGQSKMGEWVLRCNVGKPKVDGGKTYGRVYAEILATA